MILILIIGIIFIVMNGGGIFEVLLFLAIFGMANNNFTDKNRRGKWWDDK